MDYLERLGTTEKQNRFIGSIIHMINNSGNKKPGATLYVGREEFIELLKLPCYGTPFYHREETFMGWNVVEVHKTNYMRFA